AYNEKGKYGPPMRSDRITGNIFVSNLPPGFTDAQLAELFDSYGLVLIARLARDAKTGAVRNHGLVDLAPQPAAREAIEALDGHEIDGQRIGARAGAASHPLLRRRAPPAPQAAIGLRAGGGRNHRQHRPHLTLPLRGSLPLRPGGRRGLG